MADVGNFVMHLPNNPGFLWSNSSSRNFKWEKAITRREGWCLAHGAWGSNVHEVEQKGKVFWNKVLYYIQLTSQHRGKLSLVAANQSTNWESGTSRCAKPKYPRTNDLDDHISGSWSSSPFLRTLHWTTFMKSDDDNERSNDKDLKVARN